MKLAKLSAYIRRLFQSTLILTAALAVAACAFEPADETPEPAASVEQALQGCGVEVSNSWATAIYGGVSVEAWFQNYGSSPCPIQWKFQVKPDNAVSYITPVYPLPSNSTWHTVAPGATVKSRLFLSNLPGPCQFRTWVRMGSTWYVNSYLPCF